MASFVDGKGDEIGEALHGFAANVPITDSGGCREISDAVQPTQKFYN
jgi:hypothetical protein